MYLAFQKIIFSSTMLFEMHGSPNISMYLQCVVMTLHVGERCNSFLVFADICGKVNDMCKNTTFFFS